MRTGKSASAALPYLRNPPCAHRACCIEEAHVTELTALLREAPSRGPAQELTHAMRIFARRERPHPSAKLTLFEAEHR